MWTLNLLYVAIIFKEIWTPVIGKDLALRVEDGNKHDLYAVAVVKQEVIVNRILTAVLALYYTRKLYNLFNHLQMEKKVMD